LDGAIQRRVRRSAIVAPTLIERTESGSTAVLVRRAAITWARRPAGLRVRPAGRLPSSVETEG